MISIDELERLKKNIGPDGKLIIDESLSEAQRERFEFINNLNVDLEELLTRNTKSKEDDDEFVEEEIDDYVDDDTDEDLDDESIDFEEDNNNNSDSLDDLNDMF